MRIQNNVSALNAHRYYGINQTNAQKSIAKLSSGYRINSAADDAAGLAISEKMRAQIRGLTMASKNAQDGISLIQTAEGGMQEIDNMIQRIRELVVYAANDTQEHNAFSTGDRQKIQDEINQMTQEIDATSERVEFNKKKVINGEVAGVPLVGANQLLQSLAQAQTDLRVKQNIYSAANQDLKNAATGVQAARDAAYSIFTDPNINIYLNEIAKAGGDTTEVLRTLTDLKIALDSADDFAEIKGVIASQLQSALDAISGLPYGGSAPQAYANLTAIADNLSATFNGMLSTAYDNYETKQTDLSSALGALNQAKAALAAAQGAYNGAPKSGGLYFQIGPNANQGMQLYINTIKTDWLSIGDGHGVSTINVLDDTGGDITASLDNLDFALSYVTTERSKLGAAQNRLEYAMNSLDISAENLQASESRIRDVDMAKEMTNFTKQNILFQASTAMLAQANAFPQGILQLLGQ
jgi:flagellin